MTPLRWWGAPKRASSPGLPGAFTRGRVNQARLGFACQTSGNRVVTVSYGL
jgi:hypothetical protein